MNTGTIWRLLQRTQAALDDCPLWHRIRGHTIVHWVKPCGNITMRKYCRDCEIGWRVYA